jgi:hypothetical protein
MEREYWTALGSGLDYYVYAAGHFRGVCMREAVFVWQVGARRQTLQVGTASSWTALGSGMNTYGYVRALAASGNDLYAGGDFITAGGIAANKHCQVERHALGQPLDSGMNAYGYVRALAASSNDLYAGGDFTTAGQKISAYIARAYLDLPTLSLSRSAADATLSWPKSFGRFVLQQNADVANSNGWSNASYPVITNGETKKRRLPP